MLDGVLDGVLRGLVQRNSMMADRFFAGDVTH